VQKREVWMLVFFVELLFIVDDEHCVNVKHWVLVEENESTNPAVPFPSIQQWCLKDYPSYLYSGDLLFRLKVLLFDKCLYY